MDPTLILIVAVFSLIGCTMGLFSGLVPGIHVNTLATILLISLPPLQETLSGIISSEYVPVAICSTIMSASVVHSYVDFVPSVYIGAPDAEDAISVLPGHRLLLAGEGMRAVRAAAIGSLIGCSSAVLLAIPLQAVMSMGGSDLLNGMTKSVLIFVSGILLLNEWRKGHAFYGTAAFVLSGILGYAVMELPIPCTGLLGEGTLLMPMLTGGRIPAQKDAGKDPVGVIPGLKGVIMGTIAGWFPGITSTVGATVSATLMPDRTPERFISTVASIGTVTTVLSLVTLSVTGGGRSGTVIVIGTILGDSIRGFASEPLVMMLVSAAIASLVGYHLTIMSGRAMTSFLERMDMTRINKLVIAFLVGMTTLSTGFWGLVVLGVALAIGFIPVSNDIGKTVLCGCLILPSLIM